MTRILNAFLLISMFMAGTVCGAADRLVADPGRGLNACWNNLSFAGRDFWIMIDQRQRQWLTNNDDFVQDTGVPHLEASSAAVNSSAAIIKENIMFKTLAIRQLELFGEDPKKDLGPGAAMQVAGSGEEVKIYEPEALNDGQTRTAVVVRGNVSNLAARIQPLDAAIEIELPEAAALGKIRIHHGIRQDARIQAPNLLGWQDGAWRAIPCRVETNEPANVYTLFPDKPVKTGKYRLDLRTRPYLITFRPERLPLKDHIKKYPFTCISGADRLGLSKENFDVKSFELFLNEYRDTFTGFLMSEWDSNVKGMNRAAMLSYLPAYTNRVEGLAAWKHFFDYQKTTLFDTVHALSGNLAFTQYAAAWGAKTITMEIAGNLACMPFRSMLLATRGGSRQFDVPWEYYNAYYLGAATAATSAELGKSVSQSRREFLAAYYMGATYLNEEGGAIQKGALTMHGRTLKEIHVWSKSEQGARGQPYTPILFLVDYHHGRMGRRGWGGGLAWKIWNELPMEDGDYMTEQVIRATDPPIEEISCEIFKPPYSVNTLNCRLGDVFDMFFANPPQHGGAIKKEHLDRYPVAMLLGDVALTPALVERLKTYVREGGTLVVNAAQAKAGLDDPEFLGLTIGARLPQQAITVGAKVYPMDLRAVTLKGAEAAMLSQGAKGLPLLTVNSVGKGHVLLATPEYLLLKDRKEMNPFIEQLLLALQREVLPFQLEGSECQFLMNRISDNHWKVVLMNNAGVIKHPFAETEYQIKPYTANVRVVAPEGATASEILVGAKVTTSPRQGKIEQTVFALEIPPGGIQVLDIKLAGKAPLQIKATD